MPTRPVTDSTTSRPSPEAPADWQRLQTVILGLHEPYQALRNRADALMERASCALLDSTHACLHGEAADLYALADLIYQQRTALVLWRDEIAIAADYEPETFDSPTGRKEG